MNFRSYYQRLKTYWQKWICLLFQKRPTLILGVGGAGCNIVEYICQKSNLEFDLAVCNTDKQALDLCKVDKKIQLGKIETQGLSTGRKALLGEAAANESMEELNKLIKSYKSLIIIASLGGGTGSGGGYCIAKSSKELGLLTQAILIHPFAFEGNKTLKNASQWKLKLKTVCQEVQVKSNDMITDKYGQEMTTRAFDLMNEEIFKDLQKLLKKKRLKV